MDDYLPNLADIVSDRRFKYYIFNFRKLDQDYQDLILYLYNQARDVFSKNLFLNEELLRLQKINEFLYRSK